MRRLLVASISLFIIIFGIFVTVEMRGHHKLQNIPAPPVVAVNVPESVDTINNFLTQGDSAAVEAQKEILEEQGLTEAVEGLNLSEEELDSALELLEEEPCCEEDEEVAFDKPKKSLRQILMDKYLPEGHSKEDIERYVGLEERILKFAPLTFDEYFQYWELSYQFDPSENNRKNLEKWREMKKTMVPGSYTFVGRVD